MPTQPITPLVADPLLGQRLGDFVVESPIASGGMGVVYRARHPLIGRLAAIKVLKPEFAADRAQADRFLKEAQALSAIKHRGIIEIYGFGNTLDGREYMATEFLDGESLEAVNAREAPMPALRVLGLVDEILHALSAAHRSSVVHRDLKPSNVFLAIQSTGERVVKLLDFGLAKQSPVTLADVAEGPLAKASLVAGTPEYIAPEQARGLAATPRTDLYCVGVMMFEMLSGTLPFKADSIVEMLKKHVYEPAPKLSGRASNLPHELYELVDQLLEKDPEKRPSSAEIVRQDVHRLTKRLQAEATVQRPNPLGRAPMLIVPAPFRMAEPDAPTPPLDPRMIKTEPVLRTPTADKLEKDLGASRSRRPMMFLISIAIGAIVMLLLWPREKPVTVAEVKQPAPKPIEVKPPPPAPTPEPAPLPKPVEADMALAPLPKPAPIVEKPAPKLTPKQTQVSVEENGPCANLKDWSFDTLDRIDNIKTRLRERMMKEGAPAEEIERELAAAGQLRDKVAKATNGNECTKASSAVTAWATAHNL